MVTGILGILIVAAAFLLVLGQKAAAGKVISSPFTLFGQIFMGLLGASGRGLMRLVGDTYRQCLKRWPGKTLAVCWGGLAMAILLLILGIALGGCVALREVKLDGPSVKFHSIGHPTPRDQHVPKQEFVSPGVSWSWGREASTSCSTGTVMGPQIPTKADPRVHKADSVGGC